MAANTGAATRSSIERIGMRPFEAMYLCIPRTVVIPQLPAHRLGLRLRLESPTSFLLLLFLVT
jgi:hypothetical protein